MGVSNENRYALMRQQIVCGQNLLRVSRMHFAQMH